MCGTVLWQNKGNRSTDASDSGVFMPSRREFPSKRRVLKPARAFDPQAFLNSFGIGKTVCHYKPKQAVFSQGQRADTVFYIQKGTVQLSVLSKQGKEATLALLGPGDFLGEGCLASDQPIRLASATAIADSFILSIEKKQMLKALHEEHELSDLFVAYVIARHNRTQADLVDQLFNSSEKRLARALLILARFGKEDSPETIVPNVSQETLAEMVGTTRSRVNFFMNKFRKLGFIHYNGGLNSGLQVHSSLLSVVLHE
jgi:CRP-like cAMP-binding protein